MDYLGEETYPPPGSEGPSEDPTPQASNLQSATPHTPSQPTLREFADSPYDAPPDDPYAGMPPPAESTYADLPTLMRAVQDHGRRFGYACVTSSNNYKRGIAYVRCDRGGEYVNHWNVTPETRVRKNRTRRLVGCKWKARAKRTAEGGWQLAMMEDKHSGHGPSGDLSQHPSQRQLPEEAIESAKQDFADGRTPKEVLEHLKLFNPSVTPQDIYNLKAKISRKDNAEAKGKPVRGARLRGNGGPRTDGVNGTPEMNGDGMDAGGDGDGIVDPALRGHDPALSSIAQLTAAVAQMQEAPQDSPSAGRDHGGTKCDCTCCDH